MSSGYACVDDATTLAGLAALRRNHARDWHKVMRSAARRVGRSATVVEAVRCGGQGELLPQSASDGSANLLKALRRAARLLVCWYGSVRLGDIDEQWLRRERRRMARDAPVSREQVSRCFTLLRRLVLRAAAHDRVSAPVRPIERRAGGRRRRLSPPAERPIPPWWAVESVMSDSQDLRVRCAVTLQAHIPAMPGRLLALRVEDIDEARGVVTVRVPGSDERLFAQEYALPDDALHSVRPWLHQRRRRGPGALVFPKRGDPSRPTASLSKAIRRETDRLSLPRLTMQAVRRLAQASLRSIGGTRAQVRGSRRVRPQLQVLNQTQLDRQRRRWLHLPDGPPRLPSRAPSDRSADQPELRPRRRRPVARWPSTPVLRRRPTREPRRPTAPWRRPDEPWEAVEREIEDRLRAAGSPWPAEALASPPLAAPAAPFVQQTTVTLEGYTLDEMEAVAQQFFSAGTAAATWLARLNGGSG